MKVYGPKSLSEYLFFITRLLAMALALLLAYFLLSLLLGNFSLEEGRYRIGLPLISTTFMQGDYKATVIGTITLTLTSYCVFFYLLSLIFSTFRREVLFTSKTVKLLQYFAVFNLLVAPLIYVLIHYIIMQKTDYRDLPNLILHFILGTFAVFVISIFKQGVKVQSENDLTI